MKKLLTYDSVRIDLPNFTTDEDVKSFLELFFIEKDKNSFEREIMKFPEGFSNKLYH